MLKYFKSSLVSEITEVFIYVPFLFWFLNCRKTLPRNFDALLPNVVIGEKIELGRVANHEGDVAVYMHRRSADLPPAVGIAMC